MFLHSPETQSFWSVRPLGLKALARAALESTSKHDAVLRHQLGSEAAAARRLLPFLSRIQPPPPDTAIHENAWRDTWLKWFESLLSTYNDADARQDMISAIARALTTGNLSTATFLTRRFAAELAAHEWSHERIRKDVQMVVCGADFQDRPYDEQAFTMAITRIFAASEATPYRVHVPLIPVLLNARVRRVKTEPLRLCMANDEPFRLSAVEMEVDALNPEEAAAITMNVLRELLERFRLKYYVRTAPAGNMLVTQVKDPDFRVVIPLPEPFWQRRSKATREIPRMPPDDHTVAQLPRDRQSAWHAARWHVSRALATWSEDGHAAASHVWQAIEAFVPRGESGWRRVLDLVPEYSLEAVEDGGKQLARAFGWQLKIWRAQHQPTDWYWWDSGRTDFGEWLRDVMDRRSSKYYGSRSAPAPPAILFDKQIGLMHVVRRKLALPNLEPWVDERVGSDVRLLYGLRNSTVHRGERVLTTRMAMYLGRAGLEFLFTLMNKETRIVVA